MPTPKSMQTLKGPQTHGISIPAWMKPRKEKSSHHTHHKPSSPGQPMKRRPIELMKPTMERAAERSRVIREHQQRLKEQYHKKMATWHKPSKTSESTSTKKYNYGCSTCQTPLHWSAAEKKCMKCNGQHYIFPDPPKYHTLNLQGQKRKNTSPATPVKKLKKLDWECDDWSDSTPTSTLKQPVPQKVPSQLSSPSSTKPEVSLSAVEDINSSETTETSESTETKIENFENSTPSQTSQNGEDEPDPKICPDSSCGYGCINCGSPADWDLIKGRCANPKCSSEDRTFRSAHDHQLGYCTLKYCKDPLCHQNRCFLADKEIEFTKTHTCETCQNFKCCNSGIITKTRSISKKRNELFLYCYKPHGCADCDTPQHWNLETGFCDHCGCRDFVSHALHEPDTCFGLCKDPLCHHNKDFLKGKCFTVNTYQCWRCHIPTCAQKTVVTSTWGAREKKSDNHPILWTTVLKRKRSPLLKMRKEGRFAHKLSETIITDFKTGKKKESKKIQEIPDTSSSAQTSTSSADSDSDFLLTVEEEQVKEGNLPAPVDENLLHKIKNLQRPSAADLVTLLNSPLQFFQKLGYNRNTEHHLQNFNYVYKLPYEQRLHYFWPTLFSNCCGRDILNGQCMAGCSSSPVSSRSYHTDILGQAPTTKLLWYQRNPHADPILNEDIDTNHSPTAQIQKEYLHKVKEMQPSNMDYRYWATLTHWHNPINATPAQGKIDISYQELPSSIQKAVLYQNTKEGKKTNTNQTFHIPLMSVKTDKTSEINWPLVGIMLSKTTFLKNNTNSYLLPDTTTLGIQDEHIRRQTLPIIIFAYQTLLAPARNFHKVLDILLSWYMQEYLVLDQLWDILASILYRLQCKEDDKNGKHFKMQLCGNITEKDIVSIILHHVATDAYKRIPNLAAQDSPQLSIREQLQSWLSTQLQDILKTGPLGAEAQIIRNKMFIKHLCSCHYHRWSPIRKTDSQCFDVPPFLIFLQEFTPEYGWTIQEAKIKYLQNVIYKIIMFALNIPTPPCYIPHDHTSCKAPPGVSPGCRYTPFGMKEHWTYTQLKDYITESHPTWPVVAVEYAIHLYELLKITYCPCTVHASRPTSHWYPTHQPTPYQYTSLFAWEFLSGLDLQSCAMLALFLPYYPGDWKRLNYPMQKMDLYQSLHTAQYDFLKGLGYQAWSTNNTESQEVRQELKELSKQFDETWQHLRTKYNFQHGVAYNRAHLPKDQPDPSNLPFGLFPISSTESIADLPALIPDTGSATAISSPSTPSPEQEQTEDEVDELDPDIIQLATATPKELRKMSPSFIKNTVDKIKTDLNLGVKPPTPKGPLDPVPPTSFRACWLLKQKRLSPTKTLPPGLSKQDKLQVELLELLGGGMIFEASCKLKSFLISLAILRDNKKEVKDYLPALKAFIKEVNHPGNYKMPWEKVNSDQYFSYCHKLEIHPLEYWSEFTFEPDAGPGLPSERTLLELLENLENKMKEQFGEKLQPNTPDAVQSRIPVAHFDIYLDIFTMLHHTKLLAAGKCLKQFLQCVSILEEELKPYRPSYFPYFLTLIRGFNLVHNQPLPWANVDPEEYEQLCAQVKLDTRMYKEHFTFTSDPGPCLDLIGTTSSTDTSPKAKNTPAKET